MTSQVIRLSILNADIPVPAVLPQRGSYGTIFHNLLQRAASRLSPNLTIQSTEYDVRNGQYPPDLSLVDVILVTGSASSAYDSDDWIKSIDGYILDLYTNHPRIKMFGSCFGHQIICQSLLKGYGVRVEKDPKGFETGVHEIVLTDQFRAAVQRSRRTSWEGGGSGGSGGLEGNGGWARNDVSALTDESPVPQSMRLQFVHGDHVRFPSLPGSLPQSWVNVGSTRHCAVQGVYQTGRILTLQGHFEFDRFVNSETLKHFSGSLKWTDEELERHLGQVDADDDSEWAADMVVRFFLEKCPGGDGGGSGMITGLLTPPAEEQ